MKKYLLAVIWGYSVPILLAVGIYFIILLFCGSDKISSIFLTFRTPFMTISIAFLGLVVSMFALIGNTFRTEFGDYLKWCGASDIYLGAYGYQFVVFFLSGLCSLFAGDGKYIWMCHLSLGIFIYSCINVYALMRNTIGLYKIYQEFQMQYKKENKEK